MAEYIFQIVGDCFDDKYISRADCARANKSRYTVNKSRSLAAPKLSRSLKHRASFSRSRTPRPDGNLQIFTFRIEGGEKHTLYAGDLSKKCCTRGFLNKCPSSRARAMFVFSLKNSFANTPDAYCLFASFFFKKIKYCVKIKYRFCLCFNIECSRTLSPTFIIGKLK